MFKVLLPLISLVFVVCLMGCSDSNSASQNVNLPSNMKMKSGDLNVTMQIDVCAKNQDTVDGFLADVIKEMPKILETAPKTVKFIHVDGYMDSPNMTGEVKNSKAITVTIKREYAATVDWSGVGVNNLEDVCKKGEGKLFVNAGLKETDR